MSVEPAPLVMLTYARALLPAQYRNKTTWDKLLRCFAKPFQELEDVYFQLLLERHVSVATGAVLAQLGEILNEPREGRSDEAYRIAIRVKILIIVSSGTIPQILAILELLNPTLVHQYIPYFPAGFIVESSGGPITAVAAAELARAFRRAKAAGVGAQLVTSEVDDDDSFLFSDDTEIASVTQGFADDEETDPGGALAEVQE